ncbi:MAG: hypothetical protein QN178_13620 [Armatimonadota bacterium]|nr:hypothetical protein [Armatimonadota bacterium]
MDYDLFLRFSLRGSCVYAPVAFSAFRRHPGQRSIVMAARYQTERELCRRRALTTVRVSTTARRLREAAFWMMSRYRDHVLRRVWDLPALHGVPVASLVSRSYHPAPSPVASDANGPGTPPVHEEPPRP